jgi:hypothetical protein
VTARPVVEEVRCRRLVLVDDAGSERIELTATATATSIELFPPGDYRDSRVSIVATHGEVHDNDTGTSRTHLAVSLYADGVEVDRLEHIWTPAT